MSGSIVKSMDMSYRRGTSDNWRSLLAGRYPQWLAAANLGQVGDGWQGLVTETLDEISHILGDEAACPLLRITRLDVSGGHLIIEVKGVPGEAADDITRVIRKAQNRAKVEGALSGACAFGARSGPALHSSDR